MYKICNKQEVIDHLVSGYSELATAECIKMRNKARVFLYRTSCKHCNIKVKVKYDAHETSIENNESPILCYMPIKADKETKTNRLDIVVKNKELRTCILIDMFVYTK